MESIVLELLPDRGTKISYQIFHLAPVNSGDEPGDKYDWKWSLGFESRTIHNVPGHLVHPLNPTVSNQVPGKPTYLFSSDVLITVAANIDGYLTHYNAIPEIGQSETFPYRCKGKLLHCSIFFSQSKLFGRESVLSYRVPNARRQWAW
jgi:hypothetical protein